jgi:hypothetical protein
MCVYIRINDQGLWKQSCTFGAALVARLLDTDRKHCCGIGTSEFFFYPTFRWLSTNMLRLRVSLLIAFMYFLGGGRLPSSLGLALLLALGQLGRSLAYST